MDEADGSDPAGEEGVVIRRAGRGEAGSSIPAHEEGVAGRSRCGELIRGRLP